MDFSHSNNEHKLAYLYLRDEMLKFLQGGGTLPRVKLPLGGRKWIQERQQERQAQAWEEQEQQAQEQLNADENEWITDVGYISEVYSDESSSTASRSNSDDNEVGDDRLELVVS